MGVFIMAVYYWRQQEKYSSYVKVPKKQLDGHEFLQINSIYTAVLYFDVWLLFIFQKRAYTNQEDTNKLV